MNEISKDFIERMGLMAERDGIFSRIAGRMLGYFMLDGTPRSLDSIAEELRISKASASTNARMLERMGLLERCSTFGDRRDFYRLGDHPWETLFEVSRRRVEEMLGLVEHTAAELPANMNAARHRLELWRDFYKFIMDDIDVRAARWRQLIADREATADAK